MDILLRRTFKVYLICRHGAVLYELFKGQSPAPRCAASKHEHPSHLSVCTLYYESSIIHVLPSKEADSRDSKCKCTRKRFGYRKKRVELELDK